jgi:hypothetical protein
METSRSSLARPHPTSFLSGSVRDNTEWIERAKLGVATMKSSVALEKRGRVAVVGVGVPGDNSDVSSVSVFAEEDSDWIQAGDRLVGSNHAGP